MATKNVLFRIQADTAQLRRELDSVQKELQQVNTSAKQAESSITKFGQVLKGALSAFVGIEIGQVFLNFAQSTFTATAELEALEISFTTFLGSSEKAKKVLKDLEDFSISTPFESKQVQSAGRALLAFGIPAKDLQDTLRRLGDISAGTGKDFNELATIFGKAKTQGVVQGEELNQLAEAGVPIYSKLAEVLNIAETDVRKFGEQGKISFLDLQEALKLLTTEGEKGSFFGLTEELSKSLTGRASTLSDEFNKLARDIGGKLKPAFQGAIEFGLEFISFLRAIPKFVRDNAQVLTLLTGAVAFYTAKVRLKTQAQIVDNTILNLMIARERIATAVTAIRSRVTATFTSVQRSATAGTLLQTTATTASAIATGIATTAIRAFNTAIRSNPIGLLASGLAIVASLMIDFGDATDEATTAQEELFDATKSLERARVKESELLDEERAKLDILFNQLRKTTNGSKERQAVINQINEQYPTTLKNLQDEKEFQAQVNAEYKKAIDFIAQKAKSQAIEEELVALYKEQGKQQRIINQNAKDAQAEQKKLVELGKQAQFQDVNPNLLKNIATQQAGAKELGKDIARTNAETALATTNKVIDELQAELAGIKPPPIKTPTPDTSDTKKGIDDLLSSIKEKILKLEFELQQQQIELFPGVSLSEKENDINRLYELRNEEAQKDIDKQVENARKEGKLTNAVAEEFDKLRSKTNEKITNDGNKAISDLRKQYAERAAKAEGDIRKTANEEDLFNQQTIQERLETEISDLRKRLNESTNAEEISQLIKLISEKRRLIRESLKEESNLRIKALEDARKEAETDVTLTEKERQAKIKAIDLQIKQEKAKTASDIAKDEKEATDESVKLELERKEKIKQALKDLKDNTIQFINDVIDARIKESEQAISAQERRIERAKELAEKGNAELLQLEEERLDKLNKQRASYVRVQQALALAEVAFNSAVAIAKAAKDGGGFLSAVTIASTLIALASGFIQAKALAQSSVGGFASGGYTGDGEKYQPAGVVHKGEFVFTKEKTSKYRSLFEDIHKGRDPYLTKGLSAKIEVIGSKGMDEKLGRIERAIREQKGMSLSIDERGIHGIVSSIQYKQNRIRNKTR